MKLLHTSDWHLGHELYGINRRNEFAAMLLNIENVIADHKPDVMIIAGDIYDSAIPPIDAQKLYAGALVRFHRLHPEMAIIATSGNHDSAGRHEIFRHPWQAHNVYSIGSINPDRPEENIIEIAGKGYVCAVPFVNERLIPEGYFQKIIDSVPDNDLPIVLTAHLAVMGADFGGHRRLESETAEYIGNVRTTSLANLASGFDYLALGHIHTPQFVHGAGHHRTRYCGSPLAIGFDEASASHGVSIVEISRRGEEPTVSHIAFEPVRQLITLPDSNNFLQWEEMLEYLRNYAPHRTQLLRLNIVSSGPLPDNRRQIINDIIGDKELTLCTINVKRPDAEAPTEIRTRSVSEFQAESPLTIAREYAKFAGQPMTDDMNRMFIEVLTEIQN